MAQTPTHDAADDHWVDVPSESETSSLVARAPSSSAPSSPALSSAASSRRRKPSIRMQHLASPSPKKASIRKERARQAYGNLARDPAPAPDAQLQEALASGAAATASYATGLLSTTAQYFLFFVRLLRHPFSFLLAAYLLALAGSYAFDHLRSAFSPLCVVPGMGKTPICAGLDSATPTTGEKPARWADFNRLSEVQGKTFEALLDESAGGSGLALEIKKAEMATADLVIAVGVSDLNSREVLAGTLREFVEDAKKVGRGLQKLNSKVGGAVDNILAVNDYALRTIEAASVPPSLVSNTFRALNPWAGPTHLDSVTLKNFNEAMSVLSAEMARLIIEAETSLTALDALEERLTTLHEIAARENRAFSAAKEDLLANLWTMLGGNQRELRGLNRDLRLLGHVGDYRKQALAHVIGALTTLQGMSTDMEELRERVAAPQIVGNRIPVEVQMKAIQAGLERLREGRLRARDIEQAAVRRVLEEAGVQE